MPTGVSVQQNILALYRLPTSPFELRKPACARNSTKSLDEDACPCVRHSFQLTHHLAFRICLHDPSSAELFLTIDSTRKTTRKSILPHYPNIQLERLVYNREHTLFRSAAMTAKARMLVINVVADSSIHDVLVALGVVV